MLFSIETIRNPFIGTVIFKFSLAPRLQDAHVSLAETTIYGDDIQTGSTVDRLRTLLGEMESFKGILRITPKCVEVVTTPRPREPQRLPEPAIPIELRKRIAEYLSERILKKIGTSRVQHDNASEYTRKLWRKHGIKRETTLVECRGILYKLLWSESGKAASDAILLCLSPYYERGTRLFENALSKVKREKLPEECLLQLYTLRWVHHRQREPSL